MTTIDDNSPPSARAVRAENDAAWLRAECDRLQELVNGLRDALQAMTDLYVQLVDSGDAGFWDSSEVPEVIAARAALAGPTGPPPA